MNIQLIFVAIIFGIAAGSAIYAFVKMSKEQKIANLKQWLRYAVVMAEKELGSGTGQLKLRYVYNAAVNKFPWIVSVVSFEVFSAWVDEALEWMRQQLASNGAIIDYISK